MRADWTGEARAFIAKATKDLPETATLKERRAALRLVAWEYHGGTSWGRRVWGRECRVYLERHGQPQRSLGALAGAAGGNARHEQHRRVIDKLASPDIIFPYRSAEQ